MNSIWPPSSVSSLWGVFTLTSLFIAVGGYFLLIYADAIARRAGLGRHWVGAVLLATVTSVPELIAGIGSVTVADAPNLAIGEILGSCAFNLCLIFLLDALYRKRSVYSKASHSHLLSGSLGIILMASLILSLVLRNQQWGFSLAHMGGDSLLIFIFYIFTMRTLFQFDRTEKKPMETKQSDNNLSLESLITRYLIASIAVILAGLALPLIGNRTVEVMGWNEAFVGTVMIAFATSLPEIAVTLASIRMGTVDLALANIFGSNMFNVAILAIDDLFYTKGPLLEAVEPIHIMTGLITIMMTGLVLVALIHNPKKRLLNTVSGLSLLILLLYLLNTLVLYNA